MAPGPANLLSHEREAGDRNRFHRRSSAADICCTRWVDRARIALILHLPLNSHCCSFRPISLRATSWHQDCLCSRKNHPPTSLFPDSFWCLHFRSFASASQLSGDLQRNQLVHGKQKVKLVVRLITVCGNQWLTKLLGTGEPIDRCKVWALCCVADICPDLPTARHYLRNEMADRHTPDSRRYTRFEGESKVQESSSLIPFFDNKIAMVSRMMTGTTANTVPEADLSRALRRCDRKSCPYHIEPAEGRQDHKRRSRR